MSDQFKDIDNNNISTFAFVLINTLDYTRVHCVFANVKGIIQNQ